MTHFSAFKKVALVGKPFTKNTHPFILALAKTISESGIAVFLEEETAQNMAQCANNTTYPSLTFKKIGTEPNIVAVVIGGDGTMLGASRALAPYQTPLIGVNQGNLGFITDIPLKDMKTVVPEMLKGAYKTEERMLLDAKVRRNETVIHTNTAFNDVVINRNGSSGMAKLDVTVNDSFMYQQSADGLIVATPTGSTAYALAAQGPILHPRLQGMVLVPIAPHCLSNRPIVVSDSSEIKVCIKEGNGISVSFDMQSFTDLEINDVITIKKSEKKVTLLHPLSYSYYATLREKLHWNTYPTDKK